MTLGDWIDGIIDDVKEETKEEVREQDIKIVVEMFQEYHDTKENAVIKIQAKFPECAGRAEELVEKYWRES